MENIQLKKGLHFYSENSPGVSKVMEKNTLYMYSSSCNENTFQSCKMSTVQSKQLIDFRYCI